MDRLERDFQRKVIRDVKERLPGAIVLKNDSGYIQGIPDLTVLYGQKWGMLEVKRSKTSKHQPNQDHFVSKTNEMSFAAFVYPENEEEVLDALQQSLQS